MKYQFTITVLLAVFIMLAFGSTIVLATGGPICVPDPTCCPGSSAKSQDCCPGETAKAEKAATSADCQPDLGCCANSTKASSADAKPTLKKDAQPKPVILKKVAAGSGT